MSQFREYHKLIERNAYSRQDVKFVAGICQYPQIQRPYDGSGGSGGRDNGQKHAPLEKMTTSETADDDGQQNAGILIKISVLQCTTARRCERELTESIRITILTNARLRIRSASGTRRVMIDRIESKRRSRRPRHLAERTM